MYFDEELEKLLDSLDRRPDLAGQSAWQRYLAAHHIIFTRPTTWDEYFASTQLHICDPIWNHSPPHLEGHLRIKIPNAIGCERPTELGQWTDFSDVRQDALDAMYSLIPPLERRFDSANGLDDEGYKLIDATKSPDTSLETVLSYILQVPVLAVIKALQEKKEAHEIFNLGSSIKAYDILRSTRLTQELVSSAGDVLGKIVVYRRHAPNDSDCTSDPVLVVSCVNHNVISTAQLHEGLQEIYLRQDFARSVGDQELPGGEYLAALALVRIYNHMLDNRTDYGLLTNGLVSVFLKIASNDRNVLLYRTVQQTYRKCALHQPDPHWTQPGFLLSALLVALKIPAGTAEKPGKSTQD